MRPAPGGRFERLNQTPGALRLAPMPQPAFSAVVPPPGRTASCSNPQTGVLVAVSNPGRSASGAGAVHPLLNLNYKTEEVPMRITDRLIQLRAVAVNVGGFVKRHQRPWMAVAVVLLIAALVVRRIIRAEHGRAPRQQRTASTQQQGGAP